MNIRICASTLFLLHAATAAADPAQVVRDTALRAQPAATAASVAALAKDSALDLGKRLGGWYQAQIPGAEGWVRLLDVRLSAAGPVKEAGSGLGALLGSLTGRTTTTSATGVRGLDEQTLAKAQPNAAELAILDRLAVSGGEGDRFAAEAKLKAQSVAYVAAQ